MNLKGYEWFNDKGEVIMIYSLKFNKIIVYKDIRTKDQMDFIKYLKEKGFECNHIDYNNHSNLDINESVTNKINNYLNGKL